MTSSWSRPAAPTSFRRSETSHRRSVPRWCRRLCDTGAGAAGRDPGQRAAGRHPSFRLGDRSAAAPDPCAAAADDGLPRGHAAVAQRDEGQHGERPARRAAAVAPAAGTDGTEPAPPHRSALAARGAGARRWAGRHRRPVRAHQPIRPAPARRRPRPRPSRCTTRRWRSSGGAAPPPAAPGCGRCCRRIPRASSCPMRCTSWARASPRRIPTRRPPTTARW